MSPTTNDRDKTEEHYRREMRRKVFFGYIYTIALILILIFLCILFLMWAKPS